MDLFRDVSPKLVVKVLDACSSGTLRIKSGENFLSVEKGAFSNFVQIASCLDSETSLTGDPLSEFTEKFCLASARDSGGPVYYTDIISRLRDDYLQNKERSPHFVFQASARETFVDDGALLNGFRDVFSNKYSKETPAGAVGASGSVATALELALTTSQILSQADSTIVNQNKVEYQIDLILTKAAESVFSSGIEEFYEINCMEWGDFSEVESKSFIVKCLMQEKRHDEFVEVANKKAKRKPSILSMLDSYKFGLPQEEDPEPDDLVLKLNLPLKKCQINLSLIPKFMSLQKMSLILSCAPSLDFLYLFEVSKSYPRVNWTNFSENGTVLSRKWYRIKWEYPVSESVSSIPGRFIAAAQDHAKSTAERILNRKT